jgi:hypothetical protein
MTKRQSYLLEHEDAAYDLTRLHRLAVARRGEALMDPADPAVLVHRGRRLSPEEQDALDWARHDEPLHVLALDQVVSFFLPVATSAGQPSTESP